MRPVGWRYESARHALSARGIKTKYQERFPKLVKPFEGENPRITKEFARFRQRDPGEFDKDSFRSKDVGKHTRLVLGQEKSSGEFKVQSVLVKRKGYWLVKGEERKIPDDEQELWNERRNLVQEKNGLLVKLERNPSQQVVNDLHEVESALKENGKRLKIDMNDMYFARRVLKKGKIHVTKSGEDVVKHAEETKRLLKPYVRRIEIAGSIRRKKENPVDVDIVVIPKDDWQKEAIREKLTENATKVYGSGREKVSARVHGIKTEVVFAKPENWGAQLLYATGSGGHNIGLRQIAKKQGMLLNQNGLYKGSRLVAGRSEREIYRALGRPRFKQPEERQ